MAEEVKIKITAVDEASPVLDKFDKWLGSPGAGVMNFSNLAKVGLAAAATAVATFGVESVKTFAQFEKTMSGVKAVLQPTNKEFKDLNALALEVGGRTSKTATEVASSFEMLAKNGLNATDILTGAGVATIALSEATGGDLVTSADIATDVMAIFKKKAQNLNEVVNGITGVTIKSKFSIEDYALALAQGGGVAASVGVSMEDFNTSIAAISPLFASGSDAGTSFKTMMLRINPASKQAEQAMRDLGIITKEGQNRFYDAEGQMKSMGEISGILADSLNGLDDSSKNVALSTIFGTDAMRAAVGLAEVGKEGFDNLAGSIAGVDADQMAKDRLDNLSGSLTRMWSSVEVLMIKLGEFLSLVLVPLIDFTTFVIVSINNTIAAFEDWAETSGVAAVAGAALEVVMEGLGKIVEWVQGPVVALGEVWEKTWAYMTQEWEKFAAKYAPQLQAFSDLITGTFSFISEFISGVMDGLVVVFSGAWDVISGIFNVATSLIMGAINIFMGTIGDSIKIGLAVIQGDWSGAWEMTKTMFTNVWTNIVAATGAFLGAIKNVISDSLALIGINFDEVIGVVSGAWDSFWGEMGDTVSQAASAIIGIVNTITAAIGAVVGQLQNMISTAQRAAQSIPFIGGAFGGARAEGGPVTSGKTYLVGERGPELFTPSSSGAIIPNNRLGGGGSTIIVNINGLVSSRDVAEQYADVIVRKLQLSTAVV